MDRIRAMYVEDDQEWRSGLQQFLAGHEQIDLFSCVSTIQECFTLLRNEHADIVIMDIILNDSKASGLDAALDITVQFPYVKVIMLSSLDQDDEIFNEAFLNGAYDYVYKYDFEQLPEVILLAYQNKSSKYGDRLRKLVYEKKRSMLSDGDCSLLRAILDGKTQYQISVELSVSLAAVKKHVGRIMKKFRWEKSSLELAEKCKKWGLLDP
ncbi:response regulator transcription factor [Paenibacillus doosanensis]|uniref:Transcriptional regulatory protein DegU n=1 Tax=Paenibacillus konkukensis TaxID=2020716 RepID=A0ABY4RUU4_9BACL|nr:MULTISPECIES: response regulator transcription factor [Paenibacillus]MCS7463692.1 response regulator transcription factor [Paenibacillus doosanensis]UQZ85817.1 Transcriptional regulatory protein DegU [Paenibacillus konkukensis]